RGFSITRFEERRWRFAADRGLSCQPAYPLAHLRRCARRAVGFGQASAHQSLGPSQWTYNRDPVEAIGSKSHLFESLHKTANVVRRQRKRGIISEDSSSFGLRAFARQKRCRSWSDVYGVSESPSCSARFANFVGSLEVELCGLHIGESLH